MIFQSFAYLLSFGMLIVAITCYPKIEKLNIVTDIMISYITTLCFGALAALVLQVCKLPVTIVTVSASYILGSLFVFGAIVKRKRLQKHDLQKYDILSLLVISLVIARIGIHIFSRRLEINFGNTVDPAVHYSWAMDIVRNKNVSGMFFTQLHNAMFVEMLEPIFSELNTYKAFILADCFHTLMQCFAFYGIVRYMLHNSKYKFLPLVVTALYWLGYPLYSYTIGGYIYWTMGGMLVQYVIFILQIYKDNVSLRKLCIVPLVLGIFGSTICYVQFTPAVFLTVVVVIIYCLYKEKGIIINKKFISIAFVIGIFLLVCAAVGYYFVFASRGVSIFKALSLGVNDSHNLEFLIALPIIYYIVYKAVINKKMNAFSIAVCSFTVVQLGFTVLAMMNLMSSYYLFKSYYIFWSLIWLILVDGRELFARKVRGYVLNYLVIIIVFLMFMYTPKQELYTDDALSLDNSMYRYNAVILREKDFRENYIDEVMMELIEHAYVMNKEQGMQISALGSNEAKGCAQWYAGITGQPAYWINPLKRQFIDEYLEGTKVQYILFYKDDTGYKDNKEFFDSLEWLFENEKGVIAKVY